METTKIKIRKDNKEIRYCVCENAVILPQKPCGDYPMWGLGGVCDQHGTFVESSFYDGGWATHGGKYEWNAQEEEYIDTDVIYFGVFFRHWGHFLVDLVGRMWFPACSKEYTLDMKIAYLGEEKPTKPHLEFFECLGIKEEQLVQIKRPTRCKKVIIPDVAVKSCEWYSEYYENMYDFIIANVNKDKRMVEKFGAVKKVYFTRTKFAKAIETEFGEKQIEDIFVQNGYQCLAPEEMSLFEQIYIWNHAEKIVCVNGTIPLNVAFTQNEDLELLVLNKTSIFHGNLYLYAKMRGIDITYIDIYREPFKRYPKSLGEGPFLMGISKDLQKWFDENGMENKNSRLELTRNTIKNYCKYIFCIVGIRRRLRRFASKVVPTTVKATIRKIIKP